MNGRYAFLTLIAVGPSTLPLVAAAQDAGVSSGTTFTVTVRDAIGTELVDFGKAECEADTAAVTIEVDPAAVGNFDNFAVWRQDGSLACDSPAGRGEGLSEGTTPSCTSIVVEAIDEAMTFSVSALTKQGSATCIKNGDLEFYLLATDSTTADQAAVTRYGTFRIRADFTAPQPPTNVETGSGETAIPVTWTLPDRTDDIANYFVYGKRGCDLGTDAGTNAADAGVDADASVQDGGPAETDAGLVSDAAVASDAGPSEADGGVGSSGSALLTDEFNFSGEKLASTTGTGRSTTINGRNLGLETGEQATIVVVSSDKAGNISEPSDPVCITYVQTTGFWDLVSANKTPTECDVLGAPGLGAKRTGFSVAFFLLAGFALMARRRAL